MRDTFLSGAERICGFESRLHDSKFPKMTPEEKAKLLGQSVVMGLLLDKKVKAQPKK